MPAIAVFTSAALRQNASNRGAPTYRCGDAMRPEMTGRSRNAALLAALAGIISSAIHSPGRLAPAGAHWTRNVAQSRHARRQIRPDQEPRVRHRLSGAGAADDDAARARPPR